MGYETTSLLVGGSSKTLNEYFLYNENPVQKKYSVNLGTKIIVNGDRPAIKDQLDAIYDKYA